MLRPKPHARACGRIARILAGVLMTAEGCRHLIDSTSSLLVQVAAVVVGFAVFYSALHLLVSRLVANLNPWLGAVLAVLPVVLVYILSPAPGKLGSVIFVGVSLILSSIRADGGCEVMAIPGMLFGKRTHLVCIVFSPLDWLEDVLSRRTTSTVSTGSGASR